MRKLPTNLYLSDLTRKQLSEIVIAKTHPDDSSASGVVERLIACEYHNLVAKTEDFNEVD